jgi:AcrR family transcriptional regulator
MPLSAPGKAARKRAGRYHHGNLREALIHAAVRTIDRQGVEALTLRSVGAAVGVSRTALYRHFSDKDTLLAAVAAEGFRTFRTALVDAWAEAGRGLPGLVAMGRAYVGFALTYPSHYRVMFGGYVRGAANDSDLARAGSAAFRALLDAIVELQEAGALRRDDAVMQSHLVWATVHGVAMLVIAGTLGPSAPVADVLATYAIERVVAGIEA